MASLLFHLQCRILRLLSGFFSQRALPPDVPKPSHRISIPSTLSPRPGTIELAIYTSTGYSKPSPSPSSSSRSHPLRPLILNFHGGGYTCGAPSDDAVFFSALDSLDAVIVSVGYRLAPAFPFPTAIEDGADALLYIWKHAEEWGMDPTRTVVTGFSAGGNLALTVAYKVYELRTLGVPVVAGNGKIAGLVAFYPGLDRTRTLEEKAESNPVVRTKASLPNWLYDLFDRAFYQKTVGVVIDRNDALVSPGLAPDDLVREALPERVGVWTCEWDHALREGEEFRERLKALGKEVGGRIVEGVPHAWDKIVGGTEKDEDGRRKREVVYAETVQQIEKMLG